MTDKVLKGLPEWALDGVPWEIACGAFHIHPQSVRNWLEQGSADICGGNTSSRQARLFEAIAEADAYHVRERLETAKGCFKAAHHAQWVLERRYRPQFGPKQTIEHTGAVTTKRVDLGALTAEQVDALADQALARKQAPVIH